MVTIMTSSPQTERTLRPTFTSFIHESDVMLLMPRDKLRQLIVASPSARRRHVVLSAMFTFSTVAVSD